MRQGRGLNGRWAMLKTNASGLQKLQTDRVRITLSPHHTLNSGRDDRLGTVQTRLRRDINCCTICTMPKPCSGQDGVLLRMGGPLAGWATKETLFPFKSFSRF
jgi:hypothetical protein